MLNIHILSIIVFSYVAQIWKVDVEAIAAFMGACPNLTAVGDFDMHRFQGKWFTYSMYPCLDGRSKFSCESISFIKRKDGSYYVKGKYINMKTETVEVRHSNLSDDFSGGKYRTTQNSEAFTDGLEMYILDTDYTNYAIRYMCFDSSNVIHFDFATLMFRKRIPTAEVLMEAQKMAKLSGLDLGKMVNMPQEACPEDT